MALSGLWGASTAQFLTSFRFLPRLTPARAWETLPIRLQRQRHPARTPFAPHKQRRERQVPIADRLQRLLHILRRAHRAVADRLDHRTRGDPASRGGAVLG